jgi:D-galactarolactone cycloisomerase
MKITAVEPILVALPYEHGAPLPMQHSGSIRKTMDILFVRVETDEGIVGWGEAFSNASGPVSHAALKHVVGPMAVGRVCDDPSAVTLGIARQLQSMSRNGPGGFALSGLDIALWDIAGKRAGKPVHALLGGKKRSRIPSYASLMRFMEPKTVHRVCSETLDRGYRYIKLHEHTPEAVAAAREAIGPDTPLMVDVNCHWDSIDGALKFAQAIERYNITWFEEPLYPPDDFRPMAELRRKTKVPLAAGECLGNIVEICRIADEGGVDYVQPSAPKMGGITALVKAIKHVESKGLQCVPHSPYVGPALVATVHVLAAAEREIVAENRSVDLAALPIGDWVYSKQGYLDVPDGPGLGFEVDEEIVQKYRKY